MYSPMNQGSFEFGANVINELCEILEVIDQAHL